MCAFASQAEIVQNCNVDGNEIPASGENDATGEGVALDY